MTDTFTEAGRHAAPDAEPGWQETPPEAGTPGEYDWSDINGEAVERMTKPKIAPVPVAIVAQAQRSVDRDPEKLTDTGVFEKQFDSIARAETFMKFMKNAGQHTTPRCGMTVRQDPDKEGNKTLIRWQAGKARGRKPQT